MIVLMSIAFKTEYVTASDMVNIVECDRKATFPYSLSRVLIFSFVVTSFSHVRPEPCCSPPSTTEGKLQNPIRSNNRPDSFDKLRQEKGE